MCYALHLQWTWGEAEEGMGALGETSNLKNGHV